MAPERVLGQAGDARSDIYSLGCLLYAMLTGCPPFAGDVPAAVLHQQVNADAPAPSRLRHEVPATLDAVVLAMLAKAPEDRPETAERVRDRLLALSADRGGLTGGALTTAATQGEPLRRSARQARPTAATAPLAQPGRVRPAVAAALADDRWPASVIVLAVALIALAAVALLSGGRSSANRAANQPRERVSTHQTSTPATHAATQPAASTPAVSTTPNPPPPKPAGPAHGGATPPGHGGEPPGQAKKQAGGGGHGGHGGHGGGHGQGGG